MGFVMFSSVRYRRTESVCWICVGASHQEDNNTHVSETKQVVQNRAAQTKDS